MAAAEFAFAVGDPRTAAARLGTRDVHLWRMPYAQAQRRGPLVALLAAYLDVRAGSIHLDENPHGKPFLGPRYAASNLEFNWSHSGAYALVALARGCALGVDIERLGKHLRVVDLAGRFFDPTEAAALAALAPNALNPAFTGLWCAKEAVLKSAGEGLAFGLDRLAFAHIGGPAWRLARVDPALDTARDWQLSGFLAAPEYRGALAWRGPAKRISAFALR